jgi:hypothetical protein
VKGLVLTSSNPSRSVPPRVEKYFIEYQRYQQNWIWFDDMTPMMKACLHDTDSDSDSEKYTSRVHDDD